MSKQFLMTYQSSFSFEASHFNGPAEYEALDKVIQYYLDPEAAWEITGKSGAKAQMLPDAYGRHLVRTMLDIMEGTHGHNFRATFWIGLAKNGTLEYPFPQSYLIDDTALAAIVQPYNRRNLSVMRGLRLLKQDRMSTQAGAHPAIVRAEFQRRATTENLAKLMLFELLDILRTTWHRAKEGTPSGTLCARVTIHETDTIFATCEEWLQSVVPADLATALSKGA